jgi:hypothetical protein
MRADGMNTRDKTVAVSSEPGRSRSRCRRLGLAALTMAAVLLGACSVDALAGIDPATGSIGPGTTTSSPTTIVKQAEHEPADVESTNHVEAATQVLCRFAGCMLVARPAAIPNPLGR